MRGALGASGLITVLLITSAHFPSESKGNINNHEKIKTKEKGRKCSSILRSPRATDWGKWLDYYSTCPTGTFVVGMQLKTDPFHGNYNDAGKADNTGLNGVKLLCGVEGGGRESKKKMGNHEVLKNITNQEQKWGRWGQVFLCDMGFATGYQLRVRKPIPNGRGLGFKMDDVSTCNMRLICSNGQILEGDGLNNWGRWTAQRTCPKGQALCTLKTQVEPDQFIFDDTALNNVDMGCCWLDGKRRGLVEKENLGSNRITGSKSNHGKDPPDKASDNNGGGRTVAEYWKKITGRVTQFLKDLGVGK